MTRQTSWHIIWLAISELYVFFYAAKATQILAGNIRPSPELNCTSACYFGRSPIVDMLGADFYPGPNRKAQP